MTFYFLAGSDPGQNPPGNDVGFRKG